MSAVEIVKDVATIKKTGRTDVGTTEAQIVNYPHADRGILLVPVTTDTNVVYVGLAGVTTGTGVPVPPEGLYLNIPDPSVLYAISGAGSQSVGWVIQ
jgi:hypothetical protein